MKPVAPVSNVFVTTRECMLPRMPSVAVVTDTTAYMPTEVAQREGVTVVSLYVVFGSDRTERESDITDFPAFFEELRSADSVPTTSQPSVGDFVAAYEPLLDGGARWSPCTSPRVSPARWAPHGRRPSSSSETARVGSAFTWWIRPPPRVVSA